MSSPILAHTFQTFTTSASSDKALLHIPVLSSARPRWVSAIFREATTSDPSYPAIIELRTGASSPGGTLAALANFTNENPDQSDTTRSQYQVWSSGDTMSVAGTQVRREILHANSRVNINWYMLRGDLTATFWARQNSTGAITVEADIWIWE